MSSEETDRDRAAPEGAAGGVADALRAAVERTMAATAGPASTTRERAAGLVDDVVRRGQEAREGLAKRGQVAGAELARRGQEAGAELARRGQEATGEVSKRLEVLERRLAELESRLGDDPRASPEGSPAPGSQAKSEAEG